MAPRCPPRVARSRVDRKVPAKGLEGAALDVSRVPPWTPWYRTLPCLAHRVAEPRARRLSPDPPRGDPSGSDRQAVGHRAWARDPRLGAHVPVPVRGPRPELRPGVARPAVRRLRRRDPSAPGPDLAGVLHRALSDRRMGVPSRAVRRGLLVRHAAPRSVRPTWGSRRVRDSRPVR